MSLKDLIAADTASVFLNTDELAETVSYTPRSGSPRDVVAVIEEDRATDGSDDNEQERDTIHVFCSRSASSGIDSPMIEDTILRGTTEDPEQRRYAFSGDILEAERDDWILVFWRHRQTSHAGRR